MNTSPLLDPARRALGPPAENVVHAPPFRRRTRLGRVLAALAVASTVLVLGHDPAQGAAAEVDSTRLSGSTRYETAVEIAENYVDEVESDSSRSTVDTVILTSGEDQHFAYALPTPALSRLHEAPLLLTPPDELHASVTTFLTRHNITSVYIVGGPGVVSDEVESSITAISGIAVTRIEDVDEYATAVEVAELVGWSPGSPGEIRGEGRTALLATGEAFADALAAGPLAYRGEHPILLTRSSELPAAVSTFLSDSSTEHVIILGGNAAVSAAVEDDVTRLGITVERWRGSDRFGTAVDIAEALLGFDTPQECFEDSGDVGLAYGWRSPDAIVSGPLLGELCAPLLLTELDTLPSVVEDFLESDDFVTGDADGKLRFTVFGGSAAVSNRALDEAADAASLVALEASFEASEGGCHFTVTFAEPVRTADAEDIAVYLNGNAPFTSAEGTAAAGTGTSTTKAVVTLVGSTTESGAAVPTGCSLPLRARDRIGIVGGEIRAAADNRRVGRVEYFIADDETPPTLSMNATEGSATVWVESSEPLVESVRDTDATVSVVFKRSGIADAADDVALAAGVTRFEIALPSAFGTSLKIGDSVSIAADEVRDLAGNANVAVTSVVARDTTAPQVSRITVTEPTPIAQAFVVLNGADAQGNAREALRIDARADTAAAGAVGNHWTIDLDVRRSRPSSWSSTQTTSVQVSDATRRIQVMALATAVDIATVDNVVDALNANRAFNQLFIAALSGTGSSSDSPVDTGGRVKLAGGLSTADLTVEWTEAVRDCTDTTDPVRVRLIEIDADGNGTTDFDLDGFAFGTSDVVFVADNSGSSIIAGKATCDITTPGVRPGTLVARIQSASLDSLPTTRSTAVVRSGAVTDLAGNANARQTGVPLQRP